jgi:hypothetical protein
MSGPGKHDSEQPPSGEHDSEDVATVQIRGLADAEAFEETHPLAAGRDPYNQSVSDTAKRRTLDDMRRLSDETKQDRKP